MFIIASHVACISLIALPDKKKIFILSAHMCDCRCPNIGSLVLSVTCVVHTWPMAVLEAGLW